MRFSPDPTELPKVPRPKTTVFTHTDDAGVTPSVSRAVADLWRAGILDGFSVIANGDGMAELREAALSAPERPLRLAVHLNLSEGQSSAPPARVPLLVDDRGHLRHSFGSLLSFWIGGSPARRRALVQQAAEEWRAQTARVTDGFAPRRLASLDGHIHVHALPFLFRVACEIALEFGVPGVRISREPLFLPPGRFFPPRSWWDNLPKHVVLRACSRLNEPTANAAGLSHPDRIVGILSSGRMSAADALAGVSAAERGGAKVIEVVFHAGRETGPPVSRWANRADLERSYRSVGRQFEAEESARLRETLIRRGYRSD